MCTCERWSIKKFAILVTANTTARRLPFLHPANLSTLNLLLCDMELSDWTADRAFARHSISWSGISYDVCLVSVEAREELLTADFRSTHIKNQH